MTETITETRNLSWSGIVKFRICSEVCRNGRARAFAIAVAIANALLPGYSGSAHADELRIGGSGAALGTMRLLADAFSVKNPEVRITVAPSLGSGGGIKALAGGAIDLAVTSRPMDESERKLGVTQTEYRPGLGIEKALEEITLNRGKTYAPEAVDACIKLFRERGYTLPA